MSDPRLVGRLEAVDGSEIRVSVRGADSLITFMPPGAGRLAVITLAPEARDGLRELLDRAAMPGQAEANAITAQGASR